MFIILQHCIWGNNVIVIAFVFRALWLFESLLVGIEQFASPQASFLTSRASNNHKAFKTNASTSQRAAKIIIALMYTESQQHSHCMVEKKTGRIKIEKKTIGTKWTNRIWVMLEI